LSFPPLSGAIYRQGRWYYCFVLVTLPELVTRLTTVLEQLAAIGVSLKPSSRFDSYIRELEAAVPLQYTTPPAVVARRWHRLLVEVGDLEQIVQSLGADPPIAGWIALLEESLSGSFLRTEEQKHSRARDIQFELLLAAVLRNCGYHPVFAEPDIRVDIAGTSIGIAAKRPRSRARLQTTVKAAAKQIIALQLQGLVAVDISVIANPEDKHLTTRDFAATHAWVAGEGSKLAKYIAATIGARFGAGNIFGVLARFSMPIWEPADRRMSFVNQWPIISLVGTADPRHKICDDLYGKLMAA
jgi:hypothetical protein